VNTSNRFDVKRFVVEVGDQRDRWIKLFGEHEVPRNVSVDSKETVRLNSRESRRNHLGVPSPLRRPDISPDDSSVHSDLEERREFERAREAAINDIGLARDEFERTKVKFSQFLATKGITWDPREYGLPFFFVFFSKPC